MSVELMVTRALLEDRFTPVLHKIAGEQDAYARRTSQINGMGNVLIGSGSAMIGLAAKSVKVAASYDQQRQAFESLLGNADRGKAMFDDLARFTIKTPFQLQDWTQSTRTLLGWGMAAKDVMPALEGLGNAEASMGRSGPDMQKAAYELGEMNAGYISMKQVRNLMMDGVPAATMLKKELHLTGEELANIGKKHIDGKIGVQAILKGIADPENHLSKGMESQMGTLPGSVTSLKDNWNLFLDKMGEPALRPVTNLVNGTSDLLSNLEKMDDRTQKFVTILAYGSGPALTVAGGILKGVAAYREYTSILKIAKIAGDAERAGEAAKPAIAAKEGAEVLKTGGAYSKLTGFLKATGTAATAGTAAEGWFSSALAAGAVTVGAYTVILGELLATGYMVVSMFKDAGDASANFEASTAAYRKAQSEGYDLKKGGGQATGYYSLPAWKQVGYDTLNTWSFGLASKLTGGQWDQENAGITANSDAASRALAIKHGRPKNGVTATLLRQQQAEAAAAAAARKQAAEEAAAAKSAAAGAAANSYELDPALDYKIKSDERRVALLKEMGGHEKELKAARAQEISDLNTAAGLLERQAAIATDAKKKYDLLDQAADDRQKAKLLALDKSDKRDKMDKAIATILGGGGISEEDVLKRSGVGRGMFARLSGGKALQSPLKMALERIARQPAIIHLSIGDKPFAQIKAEIKNDTVAELVRAVSGSNPRALFGGN